uniref:Uncharacterized protein n=1 Tax=Lepeophtheirus salmonis TaxID=72036 RepID=A0A0K2VC73_LEPSM
MYFPLCKQTIPTLYGSVKTGYSSWSRIGNGSALRKKRLPKKQEKP